MQNRTIFHTIFSFALLIAFLVLLAGCNTAPRAVLKSNLSSRVPDVPVDRGNAQADAVSLASLPSEPVASQVAAPDATSLLENHCSECHSIQRLEGIEKTRAEWEEALVKMKAEGVYLDSAERAALLDYLGGVDVP